MRMKECRGGKSREAGRKIDREIPEENEMEETELSREEENKWREARQKKGIVVRNGRTDRK